MWSSTDGANWECATAKAPWPARAGAAGAVHNGKMWILGGTKEYLYDQKKFGQQHRIHDDYLNDVWSSADGIHWDLATAAAPWSPRAFHAVLAFDNKLWLIGGGKWLPSAEVYSDIWNSPDGVHWTKVTDKAPGHPRFWFSSLVYKNRMWIMGGMQDAKHYFSNDVWCSTDGLIWTQLNSDKVWSRRHESSAYVFDGKIWLGGGMHDGVVTNDFWQIEVPDSWLEQHK